MNEEDALSLSFALAPPTTLALSLSGAWCFCSWVLIGEDLYALIGKIGGVPERLGAGRRYNTSYCSNGVMRGI